MDMIPKITKKGIGNTAEQVIIWRISKYWNYIGSRRECSNQVVNITVKSEFVRRISRLKAMTRQAIYEYPDIEAFS
jgi:hypothetical protein